MSHTPHRQRRAMLRSALALALLPLASRAQTPSYPSKPLRWLVGYPPGGGSDTIARILAQAMSPTLGQPIVVDNRPGASANIAGELLARSPADGYTLMNPDNGLLVFNPVLYKGMSFNPAKDMKPVGLIGRLHLIIVVAPDHPAKSFGELLAQLRSERPVEYAASSMGSPLHLAMERLARDAKLNMTHIPYKGAAPAVNDFLAGTVKVMCIDYSTASQHVKAGKMRPLAVASSKRIGALPNVPTVVESGVPGFEAYAWQGLVVPAATSDDAVQVLNAALVRALASKPVVDRLAELGIEPTPSAAAEMAQLIRRDEGVWQPLIKSLGITLS